MERSTRNKRSIRILLTISTALTLFVGLFSPFYALFVERIGGGIEVAGISWAVFSIVSGILILLFTIWESKIKHRRRLLVAGLLLRSITFVLFTFIHTIFDLILVQLLMGVSIALVNPAYDALFSKYTSEENSITDWGGWEGLTGIAAGLASIIGAYVIQGFGYSAVFIPISVGCFLMSLYIISLPKDII